MEYINTKNILIKTKSNSWFGTDYTINLYRGCSHGCIYCDSRSNCYKINDFDNVKIKENAINILNAELKHKKCSGIIGLGSMSDPYNFLENKTLLTRQAINLINMYGFGISIDTKSTLIQRDIDILKNISSHSPTICKITITAFDENISKKIEPFAPIPLKRFETIKKLADSNIFCGVLLMPIIPFITDNKSNIENIINMSAENGAKFIYPLFGITLRDAQRDYFFLSLQKLFPSDNLVNKYIHLYGNSYMCNIPHYNELYSFFVQKCEEKGILYNMNDIMTSAKSRYDDKQISFY